MFTRRGFMKSLAGVGISLAFGKPALSAINTFAARKQSDALFPIEVNGKHGYIDKLGNVVIKPEFDDCFAFSEGYASVKKGKAWGFINTDGDMVIEPRFADDIHCFKEGFAMVSPLGSDLTEFINEKGDTVIMPYNETWFEWTEGLLSVSVNDKWGCIDKKGNMVIEPISDEPIEFSEGLADVCIDGVRGYIDRTGKFVIPPKYEDEFVSDFREGLATITKFTKLGEENIEYYIDKTGRDVFETTFDNADSFSEGLAFVWIGEKAGFIDKTGQMVIELKWDVMSSGHFHEGLCNISGKFKKLRKSGFIDKQGNMVIEPVFNWASSFINGLACVTVNNKMDYGYIDKTGKYVWGPMKRRITTCNMFTPLQPYM